MVTEGCSAYIPHTQNNPAGKLKTSKAKKNSNSSPTSIQRHRKNWKNGGDITSVTMMA